MRPPRTARRFFRPIGERLERRDLFAGLADFIGPALALAELPPDAGDYDSASILVRWRTDAGSLSALAAVLDNASLGRNFATLVPGLAELRLGPGLSVSSALTALRASSLVEYAEPSYLLRVTDFPDDPKFGSLYGLHNTGQSGGTPDADIDAPEAWRITTGSADIVVAVIDTGIDLSHPDLAANIWNNPGEIADGRDNDGNGFVDDLHGWDFVSDDNQPQDDYNHGTHVAGTIGAIGDNGLGVAGVNWHVQLMPLKIFSASGTSTTADMIAALQYAVANGARVSNHSYGGGAFSQAYSDVLNDLLATDRHLVVAAAGNGSYSGGLNSDTRPFYPASYQPTRDNLLAVAATDNQDQFASFSNYGATSVDLAAPGVNIYSTVPKSAGAYGAKSGTSMATPHVAGAAALLWAANPSLTASEVKSLLLANTDSIADLNPTRKTLTGGRLNVDRALRAIVSADPLPTPDNPPTIALASPTSGIAVSGLVELVAIADDDLQVAKVEFFADGTRIGQDTDGSDGWTVVWDSTRQFNSTLVLTAKATDSASQTTTSDGVSVAVENASGNPTMVFAVGSSATLGGVSLANEDIVATNGTLYSKLFDGSDVGLASLTIDAFALLSATEFVFSFTTAATLGGIAVDDSDLVRFTATSLGETTAGAWSLFLDGSDVGLSTDSEDLDAVAILPDGSLLISTSGGFGVSGASGGGEDLLRFVPTTLGATTAGKWSLYFDGSDVGLSGSTENLDAVAVTADGKLQLSTSGSFSVSGRSGGREDVFVFTPSKTGSTTAGKFAAQLALDGSTIGLASNNLTAYALPLPFGSAPTSAAWYVHLLSPKSKRKT
ncbi:MAG: S8 family serine peptidase [Pirellulaceae bacterium]|nr:S8 family serine peptidase [Pirellulaceae bacterium]